MFSECKKAENMQGMNKILAYFQLFIILDIKQKRPFGGSKLNLI